MADRAAPMNVPEFTVSEVSNALKRTVEDAFGYVRIRGEISQPKVAASGHCYMRLKDESAVIDAIIWRGGMSKLAHRPEEGMEVIASGRLTTYPGRSSYQIIIETFELAGEGALLKLLEDRRKALAAEGLFSENRKQALPRLPEVVGVVTSPTGAVIRDILHRLQDRFPRRVLLWPVRVQGEGSASEIAAAINGFNALPEDGDIPRPDLLIVARGGGSLEDLWAFNEEIVVRAAAASAIPLISAVGHETDTTLIDFASDRRAPTPTAAAEIAVPVRLELISQVQESGVRLSQSVNRLLSENTLQVEGLARGLPNLRQVVEQKQQDIDGLSERLGTGPSRLLAAKGQDLSVIAAGLKPAHLARDVHRYDELISDWSERLGIALRRSTDRTGEQLEGLGTRLESVSPKRVLERGYALVKGADGTPVTVAAGSSVGAAWQVEFSDGAVDVTVGGEVPLSTIKKSPQSASKPKAKSGDKSDGRQGSFL
ncbi:MAG: exodeoxyribonuclease VII large subunit [Alphaproteobacteria bacterium]|nr:exodeoxyribonuclease VII large subunit [Alphaproteobacteria bacterium]